MLLYSILNSDVHEIQNLFLTVFFILQSGLAMSRLNRRFCRRKSYQFGHT